MKVNLDDYSQFWLDMTLQGGVAPFEIALSWCVQFIPQTHNGFCLVICLLVNWLVTNLSITEGCVHHGVKDK